MSNWVKTILFLIGSALLTHWIPSSFFRNLDTMVHEFGLWKVSRLYKNNRLIERD